MTMEVEDDGREVLEEGTETRWGMVRKTVWLGERYYWIERDCEVRSLVPAVLVERVGVRQVRRFERAVCEPWEAEE